MKRYFDTTRQTILFGIVAWVIPFVVSIFMVDPVTKEYLPNIIVFKAVMASLLAIVTYLLYSVIRKARHLHSTVPNTFLASNTVLDGIVLVSLFGMPIVVWCTTVLPLYVIIFYGVYFLRR
jgi:hypothetical protein